MKLPLAAVIVAGIAAGGIAFAQDKDKAPKKKEAAKGVTVKLSQQSKSGQSGTARLTPSGADKTKVDITMKGAPKGASQPVHVHEGTCAKLNPAPKYGLSNVVNGKSSTEVPADIKTLTAGNLAINVHKSAEEAKVYVACGNIGKGGEAKKASAKKEMPKKEK